MSGAPDARKPARLTSQQRKMWVTVGMAFLILLPSMYGFIGKFIEFVNIYRGSSGGEFAVAPIMNYLLASAGFFCLLVWAAWNGMFRDIEKPKDEMLANEALLDRELSSAHR